MLYFVNGSGVKTRCWVRSPNNFIGKWLIDIDVNNELIYFLKEQIDLPVISNSDWRETIPITLPNPAEHIQEVDEQLYRYLSDKKIDGFVIKTRTVEMPWMTIENHLEIAESIGAITPPKDKEISSDIKIDKDARYFEPGHYGISLLYGNNFDLHKLNILYNYLKEKTKIDINKINIKNNILFISPFYLNGDEVDVLASTKWRYERYSIIREGLKLII